MNEKFSKVPISDIFDTSFHCGYVFNSANEIAKVLDNPVEIYDDKTCFEWHVKVNEIPFTIYDYKNYSNLSKNKKIHYHIGTKTPDETKKVVEALKEAGLNAYVQKLF